MAQYKYQSYNIEQFEPRVVSNSTAAPKLKPNPQKTPKLELVKTPKQSKAQVQMEMHKSAMQARKVFAIAVTVLVFFSMVLYSRVQLDEVNREINSIENSIKLAESDSIKLNNMLSSMISMNNVEDYATNVLGMSKVQDYQVVYVDLSASDQVVMANGENADSASVINNGDN